MWRKLLTVLVFFFGVFAIIGVFELIEHRKEVAFQERMEALSQDYELQRQQLALIPMNERVSRMQMERYLLLSTGYYLALDSLQAVQIQPGPPGNDGPVFVFRADPLLSSLGSLFWSRTQ